MSDTGADYADLTVPNTFTKAVTVDALLTAKGIATNGAAPATPAVPATGVALANATGANVVIYLSGGTVTAVAIAGVATGLTVGSFILRAGDSITITYSVAPTWIWLPL